MLEDFLKEIYDKALALEYCKEASFYSNIRHPFNRRDFFNDAMNSLELILDDLKKTDMNKSIELYLHAENARKSFSDILKFASILDMNVIPTVSDYLRKFTGIEVTEGKWTLESSQTGFLTLKRAEGPYVHSYFDPMWEAFLYAFNIFDAKIRRYNILGGGLGYLAYQLWRMSEGDAEVYVYEIDGDINTYADIYGVKSLIAEDKLHYIFDEDKDKVIEQFLDDADSDIVRTVYYWDSSEYDGDYSDQIKILRTDEVTARVFDSKWKNNYVWNKNFEHNNLSNLDKSLFEDEWVIVAAGPSLNDNVDFILDSKGKRTICAVNSSFKWFYLHNIKPDLCTVCDPTDLLVPHIDGYEDFSEGVPLIADWIANRKFIEMYRGPRYYVYSLASCDVDDTPDKDIWKYGGTVSSMALECAYRMGARKIYLIGIDLAYPDGVTFANGVGHDVGKSVGDGKPVVSVEDKLVPSSYIFSEYQLTIEGQIAERKDVEVINRSLHGAYLKGTYCGKWWENIFDANRIEDYIAYFKEIQKDSLILSWKEKYYLFWQILKKIQSKGFELSSEEEKIIENTYRVIYELFKEAIDWIKPPGGRINKCQTYIFANKYEMRTDDADNLIRLAKSEVKSKHNILIVNTEEGLGGQRVPVHEAIEQNYNYDMEAAENIYYENYVFPYFQLPKGMPDIKHFIIFLNSISQNAPGKIIVTEKYSLLADYCCEILSGQAEIIVNS